MLFRSITQTNSTIEVKLLAPIKSNKAKVELFDLTGRLLLSKTVSLNRNQTFELNISELKDSVYILKVEVDGRTFSEKLFR